MILAEEFGSVNGLATGVWKRPEIHWSDLQIISNKQSHFLFLILISNIYSLSALPFYDWSCISSLIWQNTVQFIFSLPHFDIDSSL